MNPHDATPIPNPIPTQPNLSTNVNPNKQIQRYLLFTNRHPPLRALPIWVMHAARFIKSLFHPPPALGTHPTILGSPPDYDTPRVRDCRCGSMHAQGLRSRCDSISKGYFPDDLFIVMGVRKAVLVYLAQWSGPPIIVA